MKRLIVHQTAAGATVERDRFLHHDYFAPPPGSYRLLEAQPTAPGSPAFARSMQQAADALRSAGVSHILLAHGTMAGDGLFGLTTALERSWETLGWRARRAWKTGIDLLLGEKGNFTARYARGLEQALNQQQPAFAVERFIWSGQNSHIGRLDGAVRLIDRLAQLAEAQSVQRVLLLGHSHGGNVAALATQLLASESALCQQWLTAARPYYRGLLKRRAVLRHWERVEQLLASAERRGRLPILDVVTLGMPPRYGWNLSSCGMLLHMVYHRRSPARPEFQATFPFRATHFLKAEGGDYIQQLGIAGTNCPPCLVCSPRAALAERRLTPLLQPRRGLRALWRQLHGQVRVPQQGTTLLVDFGPSNYHVLGHLAGHALYTRQKWMRFQFEQIARAYDQKAEG